ncbi:MAG: tetratricopeptide repeat protein [Desulfuromonadaceae bacterium]
MAKNFRSRSTNQAQSGSSPTQPEPPQRTPLWQALLLPLIAILVFFLLLEGGLALLGFKPTLKTEDPFVGFAANVPLFVAVPGAEEEPWLTTADNKQSYFNVQTFRRRKAADSYRIFCLGGSTTYGRPYNDTTSFAGWLRELLPKADSGRSWEVINAGGISYASYREANLMEELVHYDPDLFIIYTGHNEFLEERTYGAIRDIPPLIRNTVSLLSGTRTWSALAGALQGLGLYRPQAPENRNQLRGEVNARLDRSAGLNRYTRDDPLRRNILRHYRVSLERMVAMAHSVGARVIFVRPASNLKDCSPFKSEHSGNLSPAEGKQLDRTLATATAALRQQHWDEAVRLLEPAVARDPRHAELQYRLGQGLLGLGRNREAAQAFRQARDEDVCPLRALTPMEQIVSEVAREQGVPLVDFVELLRQRMLASKGFAIPGEEYFLDHVHPTIEGNKLLALALLENMTAQQLLAPGPNWGETAIAEVSATLNGRIDQGAHGQALANLARVLLWAGKTDDAERLAQQALTRAGNAPQVALDANTILIKVQQKLGHPQTAVEQIYRTLQDFPGAVEPRYMLGVALLNDPFLQREEAAANLLLICRELPYDDSAQQFFALAMAKRDRLRIAYYSLREAQRLNPKNLAVQKALEQLPQYAAREAQNPQVFKTQLELYPSEGPKKMVQMSRARNGRLVPDGIEAEWYENGRIKRFLDWEQGLRHGLELRWDANGQLLSRIAYRQGVALPKGADKPE